MDDLPRRLPQKIQTASGSPKVAATNLILNADRDAVGDKNYVNVTDFEALGLAQGYDFRPHYTEKHRDAVTEHIERTGNPVLCCPEESGVRIQGDQATVIGENQVVLRYGDREIRLQPRSTIGLRTSS